MTSNNSILSPSKINEIDQKTAEFQANDRRKSTLKRNKVQSRYFEDYAVAFYPIQQQNDRRISLLRDMHYIPVSLLIDPKLAGFMTYMFKMHSDKQNKIEPNLRHSHGYVSYSIVKNGQNVTEFPKFTSTWGGIRNSEEYKQSSNHESAQKFELSDHIKIRRMNLYDKDGMFDKVKLRARHCYDINYNSALRTDNIHALKEQDLELIPSMVSGFYRPKLQIKTNTTKTSGVIQMHYMACDCEVSFDHDSWSLECAISVHYHYDRQKQFDFNVYIKPKYPQMDYNDLAVLRRIRFVKPSDKTQGTYHDKQTWSEKNIRDNIKEVFKWNQIKAKALPGARKAPTSHSHRGSRIAHIEERIGAKLKDTEKISISEHKNIKQWHGYAKKGNASILKARTSDKIGYLMANEISIEKQKMGLSNNNNMNTKPRHNAFFDGNRLNNPVVSCDRNILNAKPNNMLNNFIMPCEQMNNNNNIISCNPLRINNVSQTHSNCMQRPQLNIQQMQQQMVRQNNQMQQMQAQMRQQMNRIQCLTEFKQQHDNIPQIQPSNFNNCITNVPPQITMPTQMQQRPHVMQQRPHVMQQQAQSTMPTQQTRMPSNYGGIHGQTNSASNARHRTF